MSFDFQDAEPVAVTGTGRKAAPNPFTDVIASIAMKTGENGKPLAKAFVAEALPDDRATAEGRIRRQMGEAGAANDPAVTVRLHIEDIPQTGKGAAASKVEKFKVTFWTVKRQTRPRTASAESTEAVPAAG